MKKKILLVTAVLVSSFTFAQDLTTKKGEIILPESGDWAIGFDATPFLDYGGNLFNSGNSAPTANFLDSNLTVYGKYFVDAQTAYRAKVRLGFGSHTVNTFVPDATDPTKDVEDEVKTSYSNITLGAGLEKRKGSTRLQGFYGGEAMITVGSGKTEYTYGNNITNLGATTRTTEIKNGGTFGFGVRGFIGAEYFIFAKISIAAEYGWGLAISSVGEGETTTETYDGTAVTSTTTKTGSSSTFGVDSDNNGGNLRIMFHF